MADRLIVTGDIIILGLVILLAVVSYSVTRILLLRVLNPAIARARPEWDEIILKRRVFHLLSYAAPAVVVFVLLTFVWEVSLGPRNRGLEGLIEKGLSVYLIVIGLLVVNSGLNAAFDIYQTYELSKPVPLTGLVQATKVVVLGLAAFLIMAALLEIPLGFLIWPIVVVTVALGFVFKDPILGFVAGIELAADNLVAIGDWIEVPDAEADGFVLDISLVAVKVQNWDNSITNIPPYSLVSNPFTNWRGMFESGGRRMKRPIYIDMRSIKLYTEDMLESSANIDHVAAYIERGKREIDVRVDADLLEWQGLTNLSVFRAYVTGYLRNHPMINQDLRLMVRLLEPTEHGLPVEIYAFSKETEFVTFEMIQSEVLGHVLGVAPEFGLKVFQYPAGTDFQEFTQRIEGHEFA